MKKFKFKFDIQYALKKTVMMPPVLNYFSIFNTAPNMFKIPMAFLPFFYLGVRQYKNIDATFS